MPRVRFTIRRMMLAVAIVALLLPVERGCYVMVMSAHTDSTWIERIFALVCFNLMGLGPFGLVWLWRRYARYD